MRACKLPSVQSPVPTTAHSTLDDSGEGDQNPVLREFVASLVQDREPECSAADNIKSMGMVFAAVKSAKEGREIQIVDL